MKKSLVTWISIALMMISLSAIANPQFLYFPVNGYGPYSSGIMSTVLDHEVDYDFTAYTYLPVNSYTTHGPYGYSNGILSFTGELFTTTGTYPPAQDACYPKSINPNQSSTWSARLQGVYTGTSGSGANNCTVNHALNYDNHPGYDYRIPGGTAVHPAASGSIIFEKCIKTFTDTHSCEDYGAVAVDHGNGFVTQYLHMANLNYGAASNGANQSVTRSWTLGTVDGTAPGGVPIHLHFEVLQRKANPPISSNYYDRRNYMIVDPYGYNTSSYYADKLQSHPGCLWATGCLSF